MISSCTYLKKCIWMRLWFNLRVGFSTLSGENSHSFSDGLSLASIKIRHFINVRELTSAPMTWWQSRVATRLKLFLYIFIFLASLDANECWTGFRCQSFFQSLTLGYHWVSRSIRIAFLPRPSRGPFLESLETFQHIFGCRNNFCISRTERI